MDIRRIALILLAIAAALFGVTFVAIKDVLDSMGPLAFVGWRFLIGALVLLAFRRPRGMAVWRDGVIAGLILFTGYASQTVGLEQTSASNSGLITGLYVVFTPLVAASVARRAPAATTVGGAAISVFGLFLLTIGDGLALGVGDVWTLACAVAFAFHIVVIARTAPRHDVIAFTATQLLTTAGLGLVLAAVIEPTVVPPASALPVLIGTAVVVTCGAFLIQVWAQTIVGPSRTAIMLALEPVFAVVTAMVVLGERLDARGWIGAAAILVGTYVVLVMAPPEETDLRTAEALSEAH